MKSSSLWWDNCAATSGSDNVSDSHEQEPNDKESEVGISPILGRFKRPRPWITFIQKTEWTFRFRLRGWSLLHKDIKVCFFRKPQDTFKDSLLQENDSVYCNDAAPGHRHFFISVYLCPVTKYITTRVGRKSTDFHFNPNTCVINSVMCYNS